MESGAGSDGGVGSIVWVRRRNGSWWPGKILGHEELPASHLTSPRTGTPVKLLGREDASVDWYNLEKSKRVKAFRCGEFDDCIERAESSQGMPPKKREKYARREDAILHALELEKELLRKQAKLDRPSDGRSKSSGSAKRDSGGSDISNGKPGNSKSNQSKSQDTSIKVETVSSPVHLQKDQVANQPSRENDHAEIIPRMRGLQNLGLKTAFAKQKFTSFGALDAGDTLYPSSRVSHMGRTTHINGERMSGVFRAKRRRGMYLPAESFDVLDYKGIPPNQIEMSPSRYLECDSYSFPSHLIEGNTGEFLEGGESGSSESTSSESESESDSSETDPDMDEDITSQSGATICMDAQLGAFQRPDALGGGSMGQGESDESSLSGEMSHFYSHDHHSVNEAVSKWQLKGKRNIRNLAKRSMDASEMRGYNGYAHGLYHEVGTFRRRSLGQSSRRNHDFNDDVDMAVLNAKDFRTQRVGFDDRGYLYTARNSSRSRNSFNRNIIDWQGMSWENPAAVKREWEDKAWHFDPIFAASRHFGGKRRSTLIDVDLKVQASYQKEPVPIVSLMSKLDGKAIIGHPIQIEALENGSTETLLPTDGYFSNGLIINHDGNTSLPPAWRTAKRTNFRVPRPHPPFALGSYEAAEYHSLDHEEKPPFQQYNVGSSDFKAGLVKKGISHVLCSPTDRKFQRKLPKKVSLFSSHKTRTLSSIGIEHNLSSKPIHDNGNCGMDGLIKPESSGPTTVACIPVKLVFSRLLEKINRPPSKPASKVILSSIGSVRDPT